MKLGPAQVKDSIGSFDSVFDWEFDSTVGERTHRVNMCGIDGE
jgi:hypothetical protein